MSTPDDESPRRALVAALGAMAGVAVLVGLAVAGVILTVVELSGVGGGGGIEEAAPESMFMPEYEPTPSGSGSSGSPSAEESPKRTAKPRNAITLEISPKKASAGQQLDFTGTYRDGDGASVQVQRKEGGSWIDFPVTAAVRDGKFATYVVTSRTGKNTFRVFDKADDKASNTVTVTIG